MSDLNLKLLINGSNDGAIRALNQVVSRANAAGSALESADRGGFGKTRAGVESISQQLGRLQSLAAGALGFQFFVNIAKDAIGAADEIKGVEARVRLASQSWQEYRDVLSGVKAIAFESGSALATNVAMISRIADPVRQLGGSQADLLGIVQAVNNALRVGNATTAESTAVQLQFAQAMGSGVLRGEELNSILENAPRLAKALADGLGITVGELKALGEQGALTSQQVFKALQSQQAALAEDAAKLPLTVGRAWTNAAEGAKVYIAELDKGAGATSALASALQGVATHIPQIAEGLAGVALVAGVAFGANRVAAIYAEVTALQTKIAIQQADSAAAVRAAEVELAVAQAVQTKTAAELRGIAVVQSYTLATNEAAAAAARRAVAERLAVANQGVAAASSALAVAKTAEAAASVGLLARGWGIATTAGRGLLALFGGPWGLAITAVTAGWIAWDIFGKKSKAAADGTKKSVADLIKEYDEFSGKSGPNEREEQLAKLRDAAAELRDQLLDPSFRLSVKGKEAIKELEALDKKIEESSAEIKKFNSERGPEKGQLGLDKLKLDGAGLVDQDMVKSLQAFSVLYADFVAKATTDSGKLKVSALEANAALEKLFSQAKSPADFASLVTRLETALASNAGDAALQSTLERAIEGRSRAESQALSTMVSGLEARSKRTQDLFSQAASIALAQYNQAYALARVAAELNSAPDQASRLDTNSRNAEVATAVQAANLQIEALDRVAERKRQLVTQSRDAASQSALAEMAAGDQVLERNIANFEKEVAAGKRTAGQLADYRVAQTKAYVDGTAGARNVLLTSERDASRKLQQIDAETAQQRAAIATDLYKTLQGKASDALSQYKTYASQVIALDKSIANNRLDTASAIASLQRTGMTPKQQLESLRNELASIQAATAEAFANGQKDFALELLQRQKSLAQQIGQASGDGVDTKAQIAEGSQLLAQVGADAEAILQEQRAAAAAAAQTQLQSYLDMTKAMNQLAQQITTLNANATIALKPQIDQSSLDAAIAAVKAAFAAVTIPVNVQAVTTPATSSASGSGDVTGRAFGGIIPGWSPHARADNILIAATAGEFMVQKPRVLEPGARAFLDDFNRYGMSALKRWVSGYAFGGEIGGSSIQRLRLPSMAGQSSGAMQPTVLKMPDGSRFPASMRTDVIGEFQAYLSREALRKGAPG